MHEMDAREQGTEESILIFCAFKILTSKPTGKRPLGSPRRRWENNIRMDLKEVSVNTRNWIVSSQDMDN